MAYLMRTVKGKVELAVVRPERAPSMLELGWAEIDAAIYMGLVKLNATCSILDLRKAT